MKLTKILLSILILLLPLIHGRLFQTLGLDFALIVSGNFEFTKSIFFNIFTSCILLVFFIEYILIWRNQVVLWLREKYILLVIYCIVWISSYFSLSGFTSLIWDLEKWHTFFLVSNLIWIYIVLRQFKDSQKKILTHIFILSWVLSSILAIKELYYPTFDYWALSARALWSFGHPNYLSGYVLLLLPFIFCGCFPFTQKSPHSPWESYRIQLWIRVMIAFLFLTTIILCRSLTALFLALVYLLYISHFWKKYFSQIYSLIFFSIGTLGVIIFITLYFPEKLHSFLSRFYLWETTLRIIFSDIKILLFGAGLETLPYYFNSYKVPEMYIFENFGYSADRPHNFFLNIFYHFWLLWISVFFFLVYKYFSLVYTKQSKWSVIILFLLYWIFHYFSITSYLLIIFAISLLVKKNSSHSPINNIFILFIITVSILWSISSQRLYAWEVYNSKWETHKALNIISHPKYLLKFWETQQAEKKEWIKSEKNYKTQIIVSESKVLWCQSLVEQYPSVENYFYCGDTLEKDWEILLSKEYYNTWLSKLPDLWNDDSLYWKKYFVKHTVTGNRFFSEKFWDIRGVLEKVWN